MKCTNWSRCECDGAFTSSFAVRQQSHHIKTVKHSYLTKGAKVVEQPKSIAAHPQSQGTTPEHPRSKTDKLAGHPHKAVVRCQDTHYRHRDSSRTFTFSSGAAVDSCEYKGIEKKKKKHCKIQTSMQNSAFVFRLWLQCDEMFQQDPRSWSLALNLGDAATGEGHLFALLLSSLWFCGLFSQQAT